MLEICKICLKYIELFYPTARRKGELLICSGPWTLYFMLGLCSGFPTVLVPQLRRANITVSEEQASWLPSAPAYIGVIWIFLLSFLINVIGRKKTHIIVCVNGLIGFIIFYFSTEIYHFYIIGIFSGAVYAAYLTTSIMILTEYTSSKYRGIFLTIKSATVFWGILVANAIGTFFHWRNIATLGIACGVYSLINVIIWPDSPLWLASKGKFKDCSEAHTWLKGSDEESEKELTNLIKSNEKTRFVKDNYSLRRFFGIVSRRQFLKPIVISHLLVFLYSFSGKLVCTVYAIDILKKITSSESTAYTGMLILDGVTVFSMYLGCLVSKVIKRRVMLVSFTSIGILFMILISAYLFLARFEFISENKYVSIALLAGYSISISCGPLILSTSIIGELYPLESRNISMCITAIGFKLTTATFLKVSPFIFRTLTMPGTFILYATLSITFLVLTYLYLPETKDKTLQEIESSITGKERNEDEEISELMNVKSKHSAKSRSLKRTL